MGLVAVIASALLAGCGGDEEAQPAAPSSDPPATVALVDACPDIEAGLPTGAFPSAEQWSAYNAELSELAEAGDVETQNAIEVLRPAVVELAANPGGSELLDARASLRSALGTVAERCASVGSSALQ